MLQFIIHFLLKVLSELPYALAGYLMLHGTLMAVWHIFNPLERIIKSERDVAILYHSRLRHKKTLRECTEGRCADLDSIVSIDMQTI